MAAPLPCESRSLQMTNVERMSGNDLTDAFKMRYRKASDPDEGAYYIPVITTQTVMGLTYPYFDFESVEPGTYVIHSYASSSGPATGTKITVEVKCDDYFPT